MVYDVHEKNLGYDLTSLDLNSGELRLIEVKGIGDERRHGGAHTARIRGGRGPPRLLLAVRGDRLQHVAQADHDSRPGRAAVAARQEGPALHARFVQAAKGGPDKKSKTMASSKTKTKRCRGEALLPMDKTPVRPGRRRRRPRAGVQTLYRRVERGHAVPLRVPQRRPAARCSSASGRMAGSRASRSRTRRFATSPKPPTASSRPPTSRSQRLRVGSGREVLAVAVESRPDTGPFTYDGRPYERVQSTTRKMPQTEVRQAAPGPRPPHVALGRRARRGPDAEGPGPQGNPADAANWPFSIIAFPWTPAATSAKFSTGSGSAWAAS